ncbi:MAG: DUF6270 domain-containing protein [Acidimicrobiia bacterium]
MSNVAIYGSCVSRDAFSFRANEHVVVGYFARSSWISQDAPSVPCPDRMTDSLSGFAARTVRDDVEKLVISKIVKASPDVVVIDLIDERFALVPGLGTWLTLSAYLQETAFGVGLVKSNDLLRPLTDERSRRFSDAVSRLTHRLHKSLPNTVWVIHRAFYATKVLSTGGGRGFTDTQIDVAKNMNRTLARWYDQLEVALGATVIEVPGELVVADPDHRWGLDHFHYIGQYYDLFIDRLDSIANGRW